MAAYAIPATRGFHVIDASGGDAWLYSLLRRRVRPLLVMRSHGLEERLADHTMDSVRRGEVALGWRYRLYHGGWRLWETTRSLRAADLVLVSNEADREYA